MIRLAIRLKEEEDDGDHYPYGLVALFQQREACRGVLIKWITIDGSTDRCCIAIVTNERALLSGSDQPVRKLGRLRILYIRRENKRSKTATFAQWYMVYC